MRRSFLLALLAAAVTILVMSVAAGASPASRPFKGSMAGTITFVEDLSCPYFVRTSSDATGTASHLGRTTMASTRCSGFEFAGHMTLVAANGDKIFADYWNDGIVPLPDIGEVYAVPADFAITGGTGRFEHAVGGGDMTAYILYLGLDVPVWPVDWVWQGTIGYWENARRRSSAPAFGSAELVQLERWRPRSGGVSTVDRHSRQSIPIEADSSGSGPRSSTSARKGSRSARNRMNRPILA